MHTSRLSPFTPTLRLDTHATTPGAERRGGQRRNARDSWAPRGRSPSLLRPISFNGKCLAEGVGSSKRSSSQCGRLGRATDVTRFDGPSRTTTEWDELRRDPELWFPDGDCLVYLHNRGQSRRGPSFRIPFAAIRATYCLPLLQRYSAQTLPDSPNSSVSSSSSEGGYLTNPNTAGKIELFIPAPPTCSREQSFQYHLSTRNFFAWLFCKPLVGSHLGATLVALYERMRLFRSAEVDNVQDIMDYMEDEAYVDMKESPDHALAILFFAENLRLQDLWTEAFVHCTGMNERLVASLEFEPVSRISKALITRAKLEMDIRLDHAEKLLTSFLDTELSGTYLGLAHGARVHLDRFRSFLLAHYVGKFGYWPPAQSADGKEAISKSLFRSMYFEFRNLYEYLVDNDSTADIGNNARPASGGLCVHQNLAAFDKRNRYTSLPHPLPLVPENPEALDRQRPFERFSRSFSKSAKAERKIATLAALSAATNSTNDTVMESSLVRAYMRFEKEITIKDEDKVSAADARKVRWILIYAVLQTLISVTRAPHEVRDTEGVSYNLCVQIAGTPPWTLDGSDTDCKSPVEESTTPKEEIKPDTDYFAYKTAFSGDVTVKHPQPRKLGFCEILVHRYGNGTINAEDVSPSSGASSTPSLSVDDQTISETSESRWSPSITGDDVDFSVADMDHLRITSPSSVYGTEEPVAVAEFTPKPLEMRKDACASMDTLALRRSLNPEVERYVAAV